METIKTIGKILSFFVFFVAASLFFYSCCQLGFARYTASEEFNSPSHILSTIYLPLIYALISLALMIIMQTLIISKRSLNTKRLFSVALMVFFGVMLGGGILMLAYGLVRIPNNEMNNDPTLWIVSMCLIFALAIIEIMVGIVSYIRINKLIKEEEGDDEEEDPRSKPL